MKSLFRNSVIITVIILFSSIALATFARAGWLVNPPAARTSSEMDLHLEQATAYLDQVEKDLATGNGVNEEALQAALVEFTLAQRVINSAPDQKQADLGYEFSQVTLDEINRLNKLSSQSQDQDSHVLKAFVQATTYIFQEVVEEVYSS